MKFVNENYNMITRKPLVFTAFVNANSFFLAYIGLCFDQVVKIGEDYCFVAYLPMLLLDFIKRYILL